MTREFKPLLCLLLIFYPFFNILQAQHEYKPGLIVTQNNDTISGQIEYANPITTAYYCYFREDSLSKPVRYTAEEFKSINVYNHRYFVSKPVEINGSTEQLFLDYLLDGIVDLYFLKDKMDKSYYFIEKDGIMYELSNNIIEYDEKHKTYRRESKKYIGALMYLTQESPELVQMINNAKFTHNSLIKITKKYHDNLCDTVECVIYMKNQDQLNDVLWNRKFGIKLSLGQSNIKIFNQLVYIGPYTESVLLPRPGIKGNISDKMYGNNDVSIKRQTIVPGIYFNISPNYRASFQAELWYYNYTIQAHQNKLAIRSISIPLLFKREFLFYNRLSPFLIAGLGFNSALSARLDDMTFDYSYHLYENYKWYIAYKSVHYENYHLLKKPSFRMGIIYGLGINYDITTKWGLEIEYRIRKSQLYVVDRAIISEDVSYDSEFGFKDNKISAGVNYKF